MAKKAATIVASREEAVTKMFAAGMKYLYRPNNPSDLYCTEEAVRGWAECEVEHYLRRGLIKIDSIVA